MISMIAAIGKNLELGKDNDLIWHLSPDMKFFRSTTAGHTVIMGRKTFESLGGLLPKRHHVVLTSNPNFSYDGVEVFTDFEALLKKYSAGSEENFIIGGGEIYKKFLPYADTMYLTCIDAECPDAQVYFPEFDEADFDVTVLDSFTENDTNAVIKKYERSR